MHVITYVCIVSFSDEEDEMIWQFTAKGTHSSQSLYKIINFRDIKPVHVSAIFGALRYLLGSIYSCGC